MQVRALKDTAAGNPASVYAGLIDHDWGIIETECNAVAEWISSKTNVDSTMPSAVEIRKRINILKSEDEKAGCVSTLRGNINKYSAVLEKEKDAEQYKHVTPESWDSLQSAVETARGYVSTNLEFEKENSKKKFPEFVGDIRSANDSLSWAAEDILFPQKYDGIETKTDNGENKDMDLDLD